MAKGAKTGGRDFQTGGPGGPGAPPKDNWLSAKCKRVTPEIFPKVLAAAMAGDMKAAAMVFAYAYGKPREQIVAEVSGGLTIVVKVA